MCSTRKAVLGGSVWASAPRFPVFVLISCGRSTRAVITFSAAWPGLIVGNRSYILVGAIIGVRTNGMWMLVKETPSPTSSLETTLLQASSAAFEATYALNRGGFVRTPIEEMFTMWPDFCSRILGRMP